MICSGAKAAALGATLFAVALAGCEQPVAVPPPALTSVEPNVLPVDTVMTVDLLGENLFVRVVNDIGGRWPRMDDRFVANLGGLALTEIHWVSNRQLEATIPVGLPVGSHDLRVTTPGGQTALLETAITVCDDADRDGVCDPLNVCTDGDGDSVGDGTNGNIDCAISLVDSDDGDNTVCADTDGDGCDDCTSTTFDPADDGLDTDGDGQCNTGDDDDDDDTVVDAEDTDPIDPWLCRDLDNDTCDDCAITGGPPNSVDDGVDRDKDGICDLGDGCTDADGDGLGNGTLANIDCIDPTTDADDAVATICADTDGDSCEDCLRGSFDPADDGGDLDGDGVCDAGDPDDDNDGIADGSDPAPYDPMICGDSDADTCDDCAIGVDGLGPADDFDPLADGPDADGDGICDLVECDEIAAACCLGDGSFLAASSTTAGSSAWTMKSADLNDDNIPDLVTANRDSDSISVLLTNGVNARGDGTFQVTTLAAGLAPYDVVPADLDADQIVDLIVANRDSYAVGIYWGQGSDGRGDGTFSVPQEESLTTARPVHVVVGDFNGDQIPDLATVNRWTFDVAVLLGGGTAGRGDRSFGPPIFYGGLEDYPRSLVAGDFNADGILDLAVAIWFSGNVNILLGGGSGGRGDGSFGSVQMYAAATQQTDIATADFNDDGILDLVVTSMNTAMVHVLLGQGSNGRGDGTFDTSAAYPTAATPVSVDPADLNGDGILDLVVAEMGANSVGVLLGNGASGIGDGTFAPRVTFTTGAAPTAAVVLDATGDGVPDIATCNNGDGTISLLPGSGSGGLPDGSFVPAGLVSGSANPIAVATADLNGDQILDLVVGYDDPAAIVTYLGEGSGGRGNAIFTERWVSPDSGARRWVHIADIDGDRVPDLLTTKPPDAVAVYTGIASGGRGTGDFNAPVLYTVGPDPSMVATSDFNADGILDLIVTTPTSGVGIGLGLGSGGQPTGTFGAITFYPAAAGAGRFALGDLNADAITDVVVANNQAGSVSVLLGDGSGGVGTGALLAAVDLSTGLEPIHPVLADFDRDGIVDLAVANFGSSSIEIYLGDGVGGVGSGTFQTGTAIPLTAPPVALMAVDIDADNRVDLIAMHGTASRMTTLLGIGDGTFAAPQTDFVTADPVAAVAGHFDADQRIDLALADPRSDGLMILRGGGSCTPTP